MAMPDSQNSGHDNQTNTSPSADARSPLLPKVNNNNTATSTPSKWHNHLIRPISRNNADLPLLFSYLTTGLLDSTATAVWGSFVSMQTGNTIYFGLGLSDPTTSSTRWIKSGVSILCFCIGSFLFARFHRMFGARRRWVLIASVLVQLICIAAAAVIVLLTPSTGGIDVKHDLHWHVLVPLGLVAFQSSGQAVISRALEFGSLTSVVLTSIYCDLFSDARLFAGVTGNVERNRRAAAPVLLLIGAVVGGVLAKGDGGPLDALWVAVGMKGVLVVGWLVWPVDSEDDEGDD